MDEMQEKNLLVVYLEKLEKAVLRELSVRKELENDKLNLVCLEERKSSGVAFDNPVYDDYDSWIELIKKQIKRSENAIANIVLKKAEIKALKEYVK